MNVTSGCLPFICYFVLLHLSKNCDTYHAFNTHLIALIHINDMIFHFFPYCFSVKKCFSGGIHFLYLFGDSCILFSSLNKYFIFKILNTYFILLSFKPYVVLYIIIS